MICIGSEGPDKIHPSWAQFPDLLADLDLSKNNDHLFGRKKAPIHVLSLSVGTDKKLDWRCSKCEHEWVARGYSRRSGKGCPACADQVLHKDGTNSLGARFPDLADEFQGDPWSIIPGTNKLLDWKCSTCQHEWKATGNGRVYGGKGCPYCGGRALHSDGRNSMAQTHPELASEYLGDATKLQAGVRRDLRWKCSNCDYTWKAAGYNRVRGTGCPVCSVPSRALHPDGRNSLAKLFPTVAKELVGDPSGILPGSQEKLAWRCSTCSHEWSAVCASRTSGGVGCPACSNKVVHIDGRNSMSVTHPYLAAELVGDPSTTIATTDRKLKWHCAECDSDWVATGYHRATRGQGCPACSKTGFDPSRPGFLYCLSFTGPSGLWWYKGGIARDVDDRVRRIRHSVRANSMPLEVDVVEFVWFKLGANAYDLEQKLLKSESIRVRTVEKFDGSSELFSVNPIQYAREQNWLD